MYLDNTMGINILTTTFKSNQNKKAKHFPFYLR